MRTAAVDQRRRPPSAPSRTDVANHGCHPRYDIPAGPDDAADGDLLRGDAIPGSGYLPLMRSIRRA